MAITCKFVRLTFKAKLRGRSRELARNTTSDAARGAKAPWQRSGPRQLQRRVGRPLQRATRHARARLLVMWAPKPRGETAARHSDRAPPQAPNCRPRAVAVRPTEGSERDDTCFAEVSDGPSASKFPSLEILSGAETASSLTY